MYLKKIIFTEIKKDSLRCIREINERDKFCYFFPSSAVGYYGKDSLFFTEGNGRKYFYEVACEESLAEIKPQLENILKSLKNNKIGILVFRNIEESPMRVELGKMVQKITKIEPVTLEYDTMRMRIEEDIEYFLIVDDFLVLGNRINILEKVAYKKGFKVLAIVVLRNFMNHHLMDRRNITTPNIISALPYPSEEIFEECALCREKKFEMKTVYDIENMVSCYVINTGEEKGHRDITQKIAQMGPGFVMH